MQTISINQTPLASNILSTYKHKKGTIFFFENLIVSEINDGVHLDYESLKEVIDIIKLYFNDKNFGYISNRINNFSASPLDFSKLDSFTLNLKHYCSVTYSQLGTMNSRLEQQFCKLPFKNFDNIIDAYKWTESMLFTENKTV
ncbi:hypothetical protein [uncultured Lacinutrix sp.]|uniref:hypothetical protein n=1 Tax=uncultured Lacinutrix sp. TaxID=574032 RepID=UPI0026369C81|nr:hypothetical protein [uncultured Lacinutrix sp.]